MKKISIFQRRLENNVLHKITNNPKFQIFHGWRTVKYRNGKQRFRQHNKIRFKQSPNCFNGNREMIRKYKKRIILKNYYISYGTHS